MEFRDHFTCTLCPGAFSRWAVASKARALGAAGNARDPFCKNPWGGTKLNTNNLPSWKKTPASLGYPPSVFNKNSTLKSWKLGTHKQVNCNRKIGMIELAKSSLPLGSNFHRANSVLQPAWSFFSEIFRVPTIFAFCVCYIGRVLVPFLETCHCEVFPVPEPGTMTVSFPCLSQSICVQTQETMRCFHQTYSQGVCSARVVPVPSCLASRHFEWNG